MSRDGGFYGGGKLTPIVSRGLAIEPAFLMIEY